MDRGFLDDIEFNKKVKIKKPKKLKQTEEQLQREKARRRGGRFRKKLMRLIFFLCTVTALGFVSVMSCEGIFSVAAGHRVTIKELIQCFTED